MLRSLNFKIIIRWCHGSFSQFIKCLYYFCKQIIKKLLIGAKLHNNSSLCSGNLGAGSWATHDAPREYCKCCIDLANNFYQLTPMSLWWCQRAILIFHYFHLRRDKHFWASLNCIEVERTTRRIYGQISRVSTLWQCSLSPNTNKTRWLTNFRTWRKNI